MYSPASVVMKTCLFASVSMAHDVNWSPPHWLHGTFPLLILVEVELGCGPTARSCGKYFGLLEVAGFLVEVNCFLGTSSLAIIAARLLTNLSSNLGCKFKIIISLWFECNHQIDNSRKLHNGTAHLFQDLFCFYIKYLYEYLWPTIFTMHKHDVNACNHFLLHLFSSITPNNHLPRPTHIKHCNWWFACWPKLAGTI